MTPGFGRCQSIAWRGPGRLDSLHSSLETNRMLQLKLSTLATGLGLLFALLHVYGVFKPAAFAMAARKFPRHTPIGWVLTLGATLWFLYYVSLETVSDFANMKPFLYLLLAR